MDTATVDVRDDESTTAWWFLDALVVEHRVAAQMAGVVLEMTLPVGHSPALHVHETLDDTWYVIEGRMAARCGDEEFVVEAGDWVSMPRGVPHTFRVVGDRAARILTIHDNGSFRDFVRHLGAPAKARTVPNIPHFPAIDELARTAASHDIAAIGPPMRRAEADEIIERVARGGAATQLDAAIEQAMTQAPIPGATVGIWGPDGEYVKTFGVADKATKAPMEIDFYHRIGSISKTFTTTALLILADQGKVSLDDPISTYVDGVPSGHSITLRNLARMSSGLTTYDDSDAFADGYFADPAQFYTPAQMLAYVLDTPVKLEAGTQYDYSNTNTTLIALVVQKASGQTLTEFVTDNILVPLKMTHTTYPTSRAFPDPHAQGYTKVGDKDEIATDWNPSWGWGAGNMISTLADMKIWARAIGTGSLLTPQMQQERINSNVQMTPIARYGLGIFNVSGWLGHSGSLFGYQTIVLHLPGQGTSLVFFTNSDVPHSASTTLGKAITEVISPGNVYK